MKKRRIMALLLCLTFVLAVLAGCARTEIQDEDAPLEETPGDTTEPGGTDDQTPPGGGNTDGTNTGDDGGKTPEPPKEPEVPTKVDPATCNHEWSETKSEVKTSDCMGETWVAYKVCKKCGTTKEEAYRPANGKIGSHTYVVISTDNTCPNHVGKREQCSVCGAYRETEGGHGWSDWSVVNNNCANGESRTCKYCNATETQPASHYWLSQGKTAATCTEPEKITQKCSYCGATQVIDGAPATGHNYGGQDCSKTRKCLNCDHTIPGGSHAYTYTITESGHTQKCAACGAIGKTGGHTDNGSGVCVDCGYKMNGGKCTHEWTVTKKFGAMNHTETCSKCHETRTVSCSASGTRTDCTQPLYCACGNKVKDGNPKHYLTAWTKTASGHERHCTSAGCTYAESGNHTIGAATSCTSGGTCSVCGYVSGKGAYSDHAWGAWVNNGSGGHSRSCTNPGCTAKQSGSHSAGSSAGDCTTGITCKDCGAVVVAGSSDHAWGHWISSGGSHYRSCTHPGCDAKQSGSHSGGTATCASGAQCADCGAVYGSKDPSNHSGGTKIENAKPAKVGEEGYTGDTVCAGCGQKLSEGQKIEALKEDHKHSYEGGWKSDASSHWHECSCGDTQDAAAHSFVKGVCSVCGAQDPSFAEHTHTYAESWNADSQNHWHVCTICGDKTDVTAHVILEKEDGSVACLTCGLTLKDQVKKERVESAVARFNDVKEEDYFSEYVGWAVTLGITNGKSETKFSPAVNCTEKEILTMLYRAQRAALDPNAKPTAEDMEAALLWAMELGMIDENFDPDAPCTRASAVTYMWMAADRPDASGATFSDVPGDAAYAEAVAWAVENGITYGTSSVSFSPSDTCNRGQIVTFLGRASGNESEE